MDEPYVIDSYLYLLLGIIIVIAICYFYRSTYLYRSPYSQIPNQIHFVFGLKPQDEEFMFSYYVAVYSSYILNKPDKIYFYYNHVPHGKWFTKLKEIPIIVFEKVDIPTHIGNKPLLHIAHKADIIRMEKLLERGGIYMDIDTISVRPYTHLLHNDVVLGKEKGDGICNAVMMTKPNSEFFTIWYDNYEKEFKSNGWNEASIKLPKLLADKYPNKLTLLEEDVFFLPSWNETDKIFEKTYDIPNNLITLHLWESYSKKYLDKINDWSWCKDNKDTLYGKLLDNLIL